MSLPIALDNSRTPSWQHLYEPTSHDRRIASSAIALEPHLKGNRGPSVFSLCCEWIRGSDSPTPWGEKQLLLYILVNKTLLRPMASPTLG